MIYVNPLPFILSAVKIETVPATKKILNLGLNSSPCTAHPTHHVPKNSAIYTSQIQIKSMMNVNPLPLYYLQTVLAQRIVQLEVGISAYIPNPQIHDVC
jgi:hypothetical protein